MRPIYVNVTAGPIVVPLNNNCNVFNVSVSTTGATTIEVCLANPQDSVASNAYVTAIGPAPVWIAAPTAESNGVTNLTYPVAAIRFTGIGTGIVLQQGIQ